ncbi:SCO family protein [Defluviimonas sp. WL0002]|uniref:SCO family protein n=1 Tax=Albidovulum marisflavi TaxID=2984159 RepID=A0ABT2Z916_9RHOB|nr:SCO family protein [Defluviimonas sp. WL0002]MCV2867256.1 SCO family protein [Defluviimonas sp. WL0002]
MSISPSRIAIASGSAIAILLVGIFAVTQQHGSDPFANCRQSVIAGGSGAVGGAFTLVDEDGRTVTDRDVLTKPSLVYFGYTFCPDICPADMGRNVEAVDVLDEMGYDVTPVFISVDPRRDTPEVLKEWTDYLHPRLIGLTGTEAQIRAAANAYKTYYKAPENPDDDYYLVDHMTQTYLMLPGQGFVEFYSRETSSQKLAESVACFVDAAR